MADLKTITKNIEKFDGSQDFEDWLRMLEATMDALLLEEADRYKALVLVLDQQVLLRIMAECKEAKTLPEKKEERTVKWLADELRKRFAYDKTRGAELAGQPHTQLYYLSKCSKSFGM